MLCIVVGNQNSDKFNRAGNECDFNYVMQYL